MWEYIEIYKIEIQKNEIKSYIYSHFFQEKSPFLLSLHIRTVLFILNIFYILSSFKLFFLYFYYFVHFILFYFISFIVFVFCLISFQQNFLLKKINSFRKMVWREKQIFPFNVLILKKDVSVRNVYRDMYVCSLPPP